MTLIDVEGTKVEYPCGLRASIEHDRARVVHVITAESSCPIPKRLGARKGEEPLQRWFEIFDTPHREVEARMVLVVGTGDQRAGLTGLEDLKDALQQGHVGFVQGHRFWPHLPGFICAQPTGWLSRTPKEVLAAVSRGKRQSILAEELWPECVGHEHVIEHLNVPQLLEEGDVALQLIAAVDDIIDAHWYCPIPDAGYHWVARHWIAAPRLSAKGHVQA